MIVFIGFLTVVLFIRWIINNYQIPAIAMAQAPAAQVETVEQEFQAEPVAPRAAASGSGIIAPLFTPEIQNWADKIQTWGDKYGVSDYNLIATVMQIESCGNPSIYSPAGATGLFQVMPYHFGSGEDPLKPGTNAMRGIGYLLSSLETHNGDVRLALAGYNGGIGGSKRPESQWPAETQRYVYWGTGIYEDAVNGRDSSDRLEEWLGRGGSSLCQKATVELGLIP
jgi:soluble lytic murein transglycosylase-like protein